MRREQRPISAAKGGGHFNGKHGRIQTWLLSAGWQIGEAHADNAMWVVGAINPMGHPIAIVQAQQPSDMLVIQAQAEFDESIRQKFAEFSAEQREAHLMEIKLGLLQMGVGFNGLADPLERVSITHNVYDDGLTKDNFFRRVEQVRYAVLYLIWSLNHKLGNPPQDNWQETLNVH